MSHSGKFVLRTPPDLHRELVARARKEEVSLNTLCLHLISRGMGVAQVTMTDLLAPAITHLQNHFGRQLIGIMTIGSRVTGLHTESSDLDLLIVLDAGVAIRRSLYRDWDNAKIAIPQMTLDPHFVHLPATPSQASAVWLEAATAGEVVWDPSRRIETTLTTTRRRIESGLVKRDWSHGHPYWTRSDHEKS